MNDFTFLVSRDHPLTAWPAPADLVPADPRFPGILLHRTAAAQLQRLLSALNARDAIVPVSGYRSHDEQVQLWADSLRDNGPAFTETYVARPGCSEHETGLAIDLGENVPDLDFIRPSFPDSGICGAFRRLAPEFGFILRYPQGKEAVTGIGYEPWHFRYVGAACAKELARSGQTLDEYWRARERAS